MIFFPAAQFDSAALSEFNNRWSVVHDFDRGTGEENWSLLYGDNPDMITFPMEGEFADVGVSFFCETSLVPPYACLDYASSWYLSFHWKREGGIHRQHQSKEAFENYTESSFTM